MNLLRVAEQERCRYTPADPKDMRMFSDEGPLAKSSKQISSVAAKISSYFADGKLAIKGGHLSVGKDGDHDYNDYVDISFERAPIAGVKLSDNDGVDGEIVIAMHAKTGKIMPAMFTKNPGPRIELAGEPEADSRFYVFREDGSLLSLSYNANGEEVRLVPRMAIASWLSAKSGQEMRYSVYASGGKTKIHDTKRERTYVINSLLSDDDMDEIYHVANTSGIGSLISKYKIKREAVS